MIDVVRGVQRGAQGVGLYRSEIPFMLRERFRVKKNNVPSIANS